MRTISLPVSINLWRGSPPVPGCSQMKICSAERVARRRVEPSQARPITRTLWWLIEPAGKRIYRWRKKKSHNVVLITDITVPQARICFGIGREEESFPTVTINVPVVYSMTQENNFDADKYILGAIERGGPWNCNEHRECHLGPKSRDIYGQLLPMGE